MKQISSLTRPGVTYTLMVSTVLGTLLFACAQKQERDLSSNKEPQSTNFIFDGNGKNFGKNFVRFDFKDGEISQICETNLRSFQQRMENWRQKYSEHPDSADALLSFEELLASHSDTMQPLLFISSISTNKTLREEATTCEEKASLVDNEVVTNRANYDILRQVKVQGPAENRLLHETLIGFTMNGMKLSDDKLKEYKELKDRLSQLQTRFGHNLNDDNSTIAATTIELEGTEPDFVSRLTKTPDGKFSITTKTPDYIAVMENAKSSELRKRMYVAYNNRQASSNTPLLQEATKIREQIGKLMGFSNYADYALQNKMATNTQTVMKFLEGLRQKLSKKNAKELAEMKKYKMDVLKDSTPFEVWDSAYIANQIKKTKLNIDEERLKEYFPAAHVVETTFKVYSQLFGIKIKKLNGVALWAPQVDLFEIRDAKTEQVLAYFYADLFPRDGKYGHAAAFPLRFGRSLGGNNYNKPVAAIVANFNPPSPDKPSLLSHDNVETFFHEFGHIMHFTLTEAKYSSLSGFNVKPDFVEAPSQMLENWVWEKEILKEMSQHYLRADEKIPAAMVQQLLKSRYFNSGIQYTRQLVFALFDMQIHTDAKLDVTESFYKLQNQLTGLKAPDGVHFPATFGHLMGGYSAGYYGYLWSKVFAEDMFSKFAKKGILDAKLGSRYRQLVLASGDMEDPLPLVEKFLERKSNSQAFFKSLGL